MNGEIFFYNVGRFVAYALPISYIIYSLWFKKEQKDLTE